MVQLPCVWLDFDGASTLKVVPSTFFPRVNSEHDPLQNGIMLSSVGELGIMFDCFALAREVFTSSPPVTQAWPKTTRESCDFPQPYEDGSFVHAFIKALGCQKPSISLISAPLFCQVSANSIVVDLAKTQGMAFGIRYAWKGDCCDQR